MVLMTATAPSHDDTISLAIENDADMKAMIEAAEAKRDKKKEEAGKAVEEETRLKEEAEEREAKKQKAEEKRENARKMRKPDLQRRKAQRLQEILEDISAEEKQIEEEKAVPMMIASDMPWTQKKSVRESGGGSSPLQLTSKG